MLLAPRPVNNPAILETHAPLAARMARKIAGISANELPAASWTK